MLVTDSWDVLSTLTFVTGNLCNKCPGSYSNKRAVLVILSMRSLVSIEQQSPRRPCDISASTSRNYWCRNWMLLIFGQNWENVKKEHTVCQSRIFYLFGKFSETNTMRNITLVMSLFHLIIVDTSCTFKCILSCLDRCLDKCSWKDTCRFRTCWLVSRVYLKRLITERSVIKKHQHTYFLNTSLCSGKCSWIFINSLLSPANEVAGR